MTDSKANYRNIRNNLENNDLSEEEYQNLKADYLFEKGEPDKADRSARFAKVAGTVILVLAALFAIQQFFFPFGPDLTGILRLIPTGGTFIVIIIGLGLLTRLRNQKPATHGSTTHRADADHHSSGKHVPSSGGFDSYAYRNSKKWFRSREEKMIFGVCGGIGERFDVDPTVIRALFVLAFFSYGFSFVVYIILAIVLPRRPIENIA